MSNYSFEKKLEVVKAYLNNEGGYRKLCKKYEISNAMVVQRWVKSYKAMGEDALKDRARHNYTVEFKRNVVEYYLASNASLIETAIKFGLTHTAQVSNWAQRYVNDGINGLKAKTPMRRPSMSKKMYNEQKNKPKHKNTSAEFKKLEQENLRLRIELDILKELRRLRTQEKNQAKKRELFKISEDNTN